LPEHVTGESRAIPLLGDAIEYRTEKKVVAFVLVSHDLIERMTRSRTLTDIAGWEYWDIAIGMHTTQRKLAIQLYIVVNYDSRQIDTIQTAQEVATVINA
jgi:hypothetical protein